MSRCLNAGIIGLGVGEKHINVAAFRPKSFVQDTIRTDFSPWQWMYRYDVY